MKIGIVVGSIREGRFGESVAAWVKSVADARGDADYEIIDLKTFDVPLLTASVLPGMANKKYDSPQVTAWSQAIDACDAYVFVTPEYNHGVPGAFKNAFDSLGAEWMGKTVGFVGYGAEGGVRAVEQWRPIVANFSMVGVRQQLAISIFTEAGENGYQPSDRRKDELNVLLDQLLGMAEKVAA